MKNKKIASYLKKFYGASRVAQKANGDYLVQVWSKDGPKWKFAGGYEELEKRAIEYFAAKRKVSRK